MSELEIILTEMFKRIGQHYTPKKTQAKEWYLKHSWTIQKQQDFTEWLGDYLYKNKQAREEIMRLPSLKTKKRCLQAAADFTFNYGWKLK